MYLVAVQDAALADAGVRGPCSRLEPLARWSTRQLSVAHRTVPQLLTPTPCRRLGSSLRPLSTTDPTTLLRDIHCLQRNVMTRNDLTPRRVQYSSCDQCRKSRVACDAGRDRRMGDASEPTTCSRCLHRGHECTFNVSSGEPPCVTLTPCSGSKVLAPRAPRDNARASSS